MNYQTLFLYSEKQTNCKTTTGQKFHLTTTTLKSYVHRAVLKCETITNVDMHAGEAAGQARSKRVEGNVI